MGDLTFKQLGEVKAGDEIIGFERRDNGMKNNFFLKNGVVVSTRRRVAPVVRITFASGREIRCTADHKWLVRKNNGAGVSWDYGEANRGWSMACVVDPTPESPVGLERETGWLAGIYDGEGCEREIAQCRHHNPEIYARIAEVAAKLDIQMSPTQKGWVITGGRQGYVDFINKVRPMKYERLANRSMGLMLKRPPDEIVDIQDDGVEEVACLETTTGNYIAWGFASRNSAHHTETIEQLMRWPWRRFEVFFDRHIKRKARVAIEAQRDALISSMNANPNWDAKDNQDNKRKRLEAIDEASQQAIQDIYAETVTEPEEDPFDVDPLFRPLKAIVGGPVVEEAGQGRAMLEAMG